MDIALKKSFKEVQEIIANPPPTRSSRSASRNETSASHHKLTTTGKKREKESSLEGSKDSGRRSHKDRLKKVLAISSFFLSFSPSHFSVHASLTFPQFFGETQFLTLLFFLIIFSSPINIITKHSLTESQESFSLPLLSFSSILLPSFLSYLLFLPSFFLHLILPSLSNHHHSAGLFFFLLSCPFFFLLSCLSFFFSFFLTQVKSSLDGDLEETCLQDITLSLS